MTLIALVAGTLGVSAAFAAPAASAGDQRFSLSSAFDNGSNQYETGPWVFKLTAPSGISGTARVVPEIGSIRAAGVAGSTQFGLADTEAAASYNIYAGSASSPEVNLTGKVRVNLADQSSVFGLKQNDYSAQMDVYQSLDKFTAKGSLGSKVLGSPTGITLSPVLYGSFGGIYQLTEQTSTGVDMSLSQDPAASGIMQQEAQCLCKLQARQEFQSAGLCAEGIFQRQSEQHSWRPGLLRVLNTPHQNVLIRLLPGRPASRKFHGNPIQHRKIPIRARTG